MENAALYSANGADELVFLDITATVESRPTLAGLVRRISDAIDIPFTVGGGIRSEEDVSVLLDAGCDKISINSMAVRSPGLIDTLADRFGSQCVVCAIDARSNPGMDGGWEVYVDGGRTPQGRPFFHGRRKCTDAVREKSCLRRWIMTGRRTDSP